MNDKKIYEEYENAALGVAVSDMLELLGRQYEAEAKLLDDVTPSPEAEAEFEKALDREYRKGIMRSFGKSVLKGSKYLLTACAAVIVVFAVSVVSVDAFRLRFIQWLTNISGGYNTLSTDGGVSSDVSFPQFIPDNYKLDSYDSDPNIVTYRYSSESDTYICINKHIGQITLNHDNEDISEYTEIIDGQQVYYVSQKSDTISIVWAAENSTYSIFTNDLSISIDVLVKIAKSLE